MRARHSQAQIVMRRMLLQYVRHGDSRRSKCYRLPCIVFCSSMPQYLIKRQRRKMNEERGRIARRNAKKVIERRQNNGDNECMDQGFVCHKHNFLAVNVYISIFCICLALVCYRHSARLICSLDRKHTQSSAFWLTSVIVEFYDAKSLSLYATQ